MIIRSLVLTGFLLLFTSDLFATAQYPDKIYFEGKQYSLHSNPMEDYFEKYPDKKPKSGIVSSALWRGYVATFEILDEELYLKDIEIMVSNPDKKYDYIFQSVIEQVVPKGERLKIDWFTGLLVLPDGKLVNYVHMGYGSTYEKYVLLEIAAGEFKRLKRFGYRDYEAFKDRQFKAFKKTSEYKELIEQMKKEGDFDQESSDSFIRSFVTSYTSKILVD